MSRSPRALLALLAGAALAAACPRFSAPVTAPPAAAPAADAVPDAPRPAWVGREPFAITSSTATRVYASGQAPLPGGDTCADPGRVLEIAAGRARAAIVRAVDGDGAVVTGTIIGAESVAAWFDSASGQAHLLVGAPVRLRAGAPVAPGEAAWLDGERPTAASARIITAERARLDAAGLCKDPHRRAEFPCCGPVDQMCHDPARFDQQVPPRCACGDNRGPCLQDFACESGQCVCRGAACPCDILKCKVGQTCGDGRCY